MIATLKKYKASNSERERDIFACILDNLFDEWRFFHKYPPKELRTTGVFFGSLIRHRLVQKMTLSIAMRQVLEALNTAPTSKTASGKSNENRFAFGVIALEQFKDRLPEWEEYCTNILKIDHLRRENPIWSQR